MSDNQWDPGDPEYVYKEGPRCGEDFCEDCGDCLYCYWEDDCAVTGDPHGLQL